MSRRMGAIAVGLSALLLGSIGLPGVVAREGPAPLDVEQLGEPDSVTIPTLLAANGPSAAPLNEEICEPGARWLRVRFAELVLKEGDTLTVSGSVDGTFRFAGNHWQDRAFFTRAFSGKCVRFSADFSDPASHFTVDAYQYGEEALILTEVVVAGAGDLCGSGSSCNQTSDLIVDMNPTSVFVAGDNAYPDGTLPEYNTHYHPSWGRFKAKTRPSAGNHEYQTSGASGYFDYFNGVAQNDGPAGLRSRGYYSYDVGDWHLIALNSNIAMSAGSTQEQWLRQDLQANTKPCTLAYWHHPRFSRGSHGSSTAPQPLWQALYDHRADVVIVGHDHNYQRFAPQTPTGVADATNGIRQFVVGTGGISHYSFTGSAPNFEVGDTTTYGVIKLTLTSTGYGWEFVPIVGQGFTDSGTGTCHNAVLPRADFNADGKPDILWRNRSTGDNFVWLMNGATVQGGVALPQEPNGNWQIVGTAAFNGDVRTDILWRNQATGDNFIWFMNGTVLAGGAALPRVADTSWRIVATGDFDHNGEPDILWRHQISGDNLVWLMDGPTVSVLAYVPSVPDTDWAIGGAADFDGDGKPDILWRNQSTGDNYIWLMDGTTLVGGAAQPAVTDLGWKIMATGDFTNDGKTDVLWENDAWGGLVMWEYDGTTPVSSRSLSPDHVDPVWRIVGPR